MPNFQKCVIYKITCKDENVRNIYIGSSTRFNQRKNDHKKRCINPIYKEHVFKVYQMIRDNGGWDNWQVEEIEKYPCESRKEQFTRERYWRNELKDTCNLNTMR